MAEVEKIAAVAEKTYPFAHALFPDELLAHQLVMDGLSRSVLTFLKRDEKELADLNLDWKLVCASVFVLAKKRSEHATLIKMPQDDFFKMDMDLRAALFLRHRYLVDAEEAGDIMGIRLNEFFSFLHQGWDFLERQFKTKV